jgi:hypothetical protein
VPPARSRTRPRDVWLWRDWRRRPTSPTLPARSLTRLARQLAPSPRVALLRRAQRQFPADSWVNMIWDWSCAS